MSLFFFNDTATTEIYTLSLHDALPISRGYERKARVVGPVRLLLDRRDQAIRDRDRAGNDIGIEDEPSVDAGDGGPASGHGSVRSGVTPGSSTSKRTSSA